MVPAVLFVFGLVAFVTGAPPWLSALLILGAAAIAAVSVIVDRAERANRPGTAERMLVG